MDSKKIGKFIALNRKKKGLTQEQLGEKLGVSNKTISRWENGNYMPDLSLLEPLSKELGISLNELLAGEYIEKEKMIEYSEQNIKTTIDYTKKKINHEHKKISAFLIGSGIFICIFAFAVLPSENSWGQIYSLIGLLLIVSGIYRELPFTSYWKKGAASAAVFFLILSMFFIIDYIRVIQLKQPPAYRYKITVIYNDSKRIEYQNPFYNVYRINADTPNEYYLIDREKQYTIDTVPASPFNLEKSGIQNLLQYQNKYVGNNSNTRQLIENLPLSEYGFVFEIDSENNGIIIDYHHTDWYNNENMYIQKALVYNSITSFALIDNLNYIRFNFSGSTYSVTREAIENNDPHFKDLLTNDTIDLQNFNKYVDQRIKDTTFISNILRLYTK